jgi:hypothetical protein
MNKLAFVGRFLGVFALLIVLGWASGAPHRYATALRVTTTALSPVTNGWWLETRTNAAGKEEMRFRRGETELKVLLSLDALALGLLPLLSLIAATPGLGARRLATACALGVAGLFGLDVLVLLLYPYLVSQPNAFTDIVGTFLGLLTFVGGPVILWFLLTFDRLRAVWHLDSEATGTL